MKLKLILLFLTFTTCHGKVRLFIDGQLERCDPKASSELINNCDLEFLVENDETYVNGNCTFNADVEVWKANFWTEKKVKGSWFRAPIQGSNVDVCKNLVDEEELFNPFFKGLAGCPFKNGVCIFIS